MGQELQRDRGLDAGEQGPGAGPPGPGQGRELVRRRCRIATRFSRVRTTVRSALACPEYGAATRRQW
jgi:hypothetical protein